MTIDTHPKLRLSHFVVTGLFGRFDHEFSISTDDRVTILHGPNGIGKTAVLKLLFSLFAGRIFQVFAIRFVTLRVRFTNGTTLHIHRKHADRDDKSEQIGVYLVSANGEVIERNDAYLDSRTLTKFASSLARSAPYLQRIDDDLWLDRRSSETLSTSDLLMKFDEPDSDIRLARIAIGENIKPLLSVQSAIQNISKQVDVHFIETQRLLSKRRRGEKKIYGREEGDSEVRTTVSECAEELKKQISAGLSAYARESQKLDQSFPMRLLRLEPHDVSFDLLQSRLKAIGEKRRKLAEIGLLIEKTDPSTVSVEGLDLSNADASALRVIELFIDDAAYKLSTLDGVLKFASLFFSVVNSRFRHKRLVLDTERGLIATTSNFEIIDLEALSSGEQHQLVLFYDLIFKANQNSLVLIDEPELSLHVAWQKTMLASLIEIADVNKLDIVMATHSPYIVGDRVDLMQDLYSNDVENQFV